MSEFSKKKYAKVAGEDAGTAFGGSGHLLPLNWWEMFLLCISIKWHRRRCSICSHNNIMAWEHLQKRWLWGNRQCRHILYKFGWIA